MDDEQDLSTNKKNDEIVKKYQDTALKFETLLGTFEGYNNLNRLDLYKECLSSLEELKENEENNEYLEFLLSIENMVVWQTDYIRKHLEKPDEKRPNLTIKGDMGIGFGSSLAKKRKPVDQRAEERLDIIKSTKQNLTGQGLDDIKGLERIKQLLRKSVILPINFPGLFKGGRTPWSRVLLFGPPGTGKTRIAQALATEAKASFYSVTCADLLSSWMGESEKIIKDLFRHSRNESERSILFIDEIDSICRKRSDKESDSSRCIKNQLLIEMDSNTSTDNKLFIICATNCPWDLDTAFLRRFQLRLFIPLPDRDARIEIIKKLCEGLSTNINQDEWFEIGNMTEGYSGSDLVSVTTMALHQPLDDLEVSCSWFINENGDWTPCSDSVPGSFRANLNSVPPDKVVLRSVTFKDFMKAIVAIPKTVLKIDIDMYNKYVIQQGS